MGKSIPGLSGEDAVSIDKIGDGIMDGGFPGGVETPVEINFLANEDMGTLCLTRSLGRTSTTSSHG